MGRDVSVRCRCWEDGRTTDPPVSRDLIRPVDRTDPYRQVPEIRDDITVPPDAIRAFDAWREQACPHDHMSVLTERVWKWRGTRVYSNLAATLDSDRFPVLASIDYGYGDDERPLSAEDAATALTELDDLSEYAGTTDLGELTEAVDVASGARWWLHLDGEEPLVYQAPPWAIGLDRRGLFIWDLKAPNAATRAELVRAVRLSVRLGAPVNDRTPEHHRRFQHATAGPCDCVQVEFTDLDTGDAGTLPMARLGRPFHRESPYRRDPLLPGNTHYLRVWTRPVLLADFTDVLSTLRRIFRTTAETGTAAVWF
jgi:hypothetical protein